VSGYCLKIVRGRAADIHVFHPSQSCLEYGERNQKRSGGKGTVTLFEELPEGNGLVWYRKTWMGKERKTEQKSEGTEEEFRSRCDKDTKSFAAEVEIAAAPREKKFSREQFGNAEGNHRLLAHRRSRQAEKDGCRKEGLNYRNAVNLLGGESDRRAGENKGLVPNTLGNFGGKTIREGSPLGNVLRQAETRPVAARC